MNVVLYSNFSKKENSTLQPSGSGTTFDCKLKDATGVLSPQLEFHFASGNPGSYNYARINTFGRYYFIREWTYDKGIWIAQLEVDTLATWKSYIGVSTLYVLRAADLIAWNNKAVDNAYPMLEPENSAVYIAENDIWSRTGESMVLGIIGPGTDQYGSVNYYVLTPNQAGSILKYLMTGDPTASHSYTNDALHTYNIADAFINSLYRAFVDPMKYIVSCVAYPFAVASNASDPAIFAGKLPCYFAPAGFEWPMLKGTCIQFIGDYYFEVQHHPQAASRGMYLNSSPYSQYILDIQPWGRIALDSTALADMKYVQASVYVDIRTQDTSLELRAAASTSAQSARIYLGTYYSKIGVSVQLAQLTSNLATSKIEALPTVLNALATENYVGAAAAVGSSFANPEFYLSSEGVNGSFLPTVTSFPRLETHYHNVADEDLDHKGRPVLANKVIGTLSGFIQCAEGDIDLPSTQQERETVAGYLTAGFFYE